METFRPWETRRIRRCRCEGKDASEQRPREASCETYFGQFSQMASMPTSRRTRPASPSVRSMVEDEIGEELNTDTRSWMTAPCAAAARTGRDPNITKLRPNLAMAAESFMAAPLFCRRDSGWAPGTSMPGGWQSVNGGNAITRRRSAGWSTNHA